MTQEDKQLLLKDLCARIPYHTLVQLNPGAYNKPETCLLTGVHGEKVHLNVDSDPFRIASVKPYLRPMSSMTEEEGKEWEQLLNYNLSDENEMMVTVFVEDIPDYIDWFNKHHFDYRGLIDKSLALEAPEGMYKIE